MQTVGMLSALLVLLYEWSIWRKVLPQAKNAAKEKRSKVFSNDASGRVWRFAVPQQCLSPWRCG